MQGSAGFCSLVSIFHDLEHPTFANLWQSCHILVLLSTSFSVFLFLSHQLLRVVPLLDPFLHRFSPHVPTIAIFSQKLFQSHYTSHFTNLLIVHFIFQGFPTYHSQHSHFCGLQPLFIFHFQCIKLIWLLDLQYNYFLNEKLLWRSNSKFCQLQLQNQKVF